MRRVRQGLDRAELAACERIIELYVPYILVRCARYTNRRRQAEQIGVYTLVTTCLLASRLDRVRQLGVLVDVMLDVVGPDVVSGGEGHEWWGGCDELLIVDRRMCRMAAALNFLHRPWREVLILHHVAGMDVGDLTRWLLRPADEVVTRITRGEKLLAERFAVSDARPLLAQFAAGLDAGWMQEVADAALEYLAQRTRGA